MEHAQKNTRNGVLVVDGEELILSFLAFALKENGFQAWTCTTGDKAVAILREHAGDIGVALVDAGESRDNLKLIRQHAPQLPCCAMSAILNDTDEAELRKLGAAAVLAKPFRLENCLHILRSIASAKSSLP